MICTHSYIDFRYIAKNHQPIVHTSRKTRIQDSSQKGKVTRYLEHIMSGVGVGEIEGEEKKAGMTRKIESVE